MLALEHGHPWARALRSWFGALPERPRAVLSISAHWWTQDLRITTGNPPGIMHDFGGFPEALYHLDYPSPGDPALASRVQSLLASAGLQVTADVERPLDHGTWSVLRHGLPEAEIPVLQLSLPRWAPARLDALGQALAPLRDEGVLMLGSGGLVHNLRRLQWQDENAAVESWAKEAETWLMERLLGGRREELFEHRHLNPLSEASAPSTEHLDPLFVTLGAAGGSAPDTLFDGWQHGTLSLRSLAWS
jgi:4,5-DOPA dioxygenase extradiol